MTINIARAATDMTETVPSPTSLDAYKVDFKWRDFKGVITDNKTNAHIMDVDCKGMRKPQIKFFKGWEEIGTAALNTVSIHAECEIRGRAKRIQAMKRWTTEYTYLSDAFADGGLPVAVYWTSSSGFKYWDFILLDSNKEPVARFRSNVWAYKHVGIIEFMGDFSQLAKEEICITGCTVYLNFLQRANNVFQLFGAIGAKTGPLDANNLDVQKQSVPAQKVDTDFEETRTSTGGTTVR